MSAQHDPVQSALTLWDMPAATFRFVAGRENRVYKVTHGRARYALRFKRPGYHSEAELMSELEWLVEMDRAGLRVPLPTRSKNGRLLETLHGQHVDLVTWLDGHPIGQSRSALKLDDPLATFRSIGVEMARLHLACDAWALPADFTRSRWDADGLLGEAPRWGRFWENPTLDAATKALFVEFRSQARRHLDALELDFGLIHADMVRENVLLEGEAVSLIDFDDGGFGYRLFDVATALLKYRGEPLYHDLKASLIDGYLSLRRLDMDALDLFLALRATTYVGWIVPRMHEPEGEVRNTRFIEDARAMCEAYFNTSSVTEGTTP